MRSFIVITVVCFLAVAGTPSGQQTDVLNAASDAMGAANLKTLQFSGWGWGVSFVGVGQNYAPDDPWPRLNVKDYTALINYDTASMRVELVREMGAIMPLGGGVPFTGEQRQIQVVSGNSAWNVPVPTPEAPAGGAAASGPPAQPQPAAALERMLALWATPHGFVKAALANKATTQNVPGGTQVSFEVGGKYKMIGTINQRNEVERVQTWIANPVAGDLLVETVYRGYRDFGGLLFPSSIVQRQGGHPTLDLTTVSVQANPPAEIATPENVRGASPPPSVLEARKLAEGVYFLIGGAGYNSLAVEMKDHIVMVETPNNEARTLALFAKAKELFPGKPIRFVINMHHHWDHSGGIRTAIDEGATIVVHETAKAFFERVATMPHTLDPDRLSRSKKAPKFMTVGGKGLTLTDGSRTIEVHEIAPNQHATSFMMVYLPKEKILSEGDGYNSQLHLGERLISVEMPKAEMLYDSIRRLKLDVQTIAPIHGRRTTDMAEFEQSLGKRNSSN